MLKSLIIEDSYLKPVKLDFYEEDNSYLFLGSDPVLRNVIGDTLRLLKLAVNPENTSNWNKNLLENGLIKNIEESKLIIVEVRLQQLQYQYRIEAIKKNSKIIELRTKLEIEDNSNATPEEYTKFKKWVDRILVIKPDYQRFGSDSFKSEEQSLLNYSCTNLSSFLQFFMTCEPLFYSFQDIVRKKKEYFKDIFVYHNILHIKSKSDQILKVKDIPNGDKAYLLFLIMTHLYSKIESPILVWEYPEIELPFSEIEDLITNLILAFRRNRSSNLFILSNNYEVMTRFYQENLIICNKGEILRTKFQFMTKYEESLREYLMINNC